VDTRGRFVWFNQASKRVFQEFSLQPGGDVREFYSRGTIFEDDGSKEVVNYRRIYKLAGKARRSKQPNRYSQMVLTLGNDFVFFDSRPQIKLANPVAASLQVSTLHHRTYGGKPIGSLGLMSVPTFLLKRWETEDLPRIFVAIPFREAWNSDVYEAIEASIIGAGYSPIRVDHQQRRDDILKDILLSIQECKLIIADVTGSNENVLFELGYALALHKPYVIINQNRRKSAFDIVHLPQEKYSRKKLAELRIKLFDLINEGGAKLSQPA
jgi:hypothetical protein